MRTSSLISTLLATSFLTALLLASSLAHADRAQDTWNQIQRHRQLLRDRPSGPRTPTRMFSFCLQASALHKSHPKLDTDMADTVRELCVAAVIDVPKCRYACVKAKLVGDAIEVLEGIGDLDATTSKQILEIKASIAPELEARSFREQLDAATLAHGTPCKALPLWRSVLARVPPDAEAKYRALIKEVRAGKKQIMMHQIIRDPARKAMYFGWKYRAEIYKRANQFASVGVSSIPEAQAAITKATSAAKLYKCLADYKDSAVRVESMGKVVANIRAYIVADEKCLADPLCRAGRIERDICMAIEDRKQIKANIKKEKRYSRRAGVVNLSDLQDLKEQLIMADEEIARASVEYRVLSGSKFKAKICGRVLRDGPRGAQKHTLKSVTTDDDCANSNDPLCGL